MHPLRLRARDLRNSATDAERCLWRHLRASHLGVRFRRQVPMAGYIADFVAPGLRLVIELDGGQHLEQRGYDAARTHALERLGYTVLRFWNDDVLVRTPAVLEAIHAEIQRLRVGRSG